MSVPIEVAMNTTNRLTVDRDARFKICGVTGHGTEPPGNRPPTKSGSSFTLSLEFVVFNRCDMTANASHVGGANLSAIAENVFVASLDLASATVMLRAIPCQDPTCRELPSARIRLKRIARRENA